MPLNDLKKTFPWPIAKPEVDPDDHGWMDLRHERFFLNNIPKDASVILELGCWLGKSTRFLAKSFKNSQIISVDHWRGSPEHDDIDGKRAAKSKLGTLYETFLVNLWSHKDMVTPVRLDTANAIILLGYYGIKPDVVYVDAGHDFESVLSDLLLIHEYFPDTLILGDDYMWKDGTGKRPVAMAVGEFCKKTGLTVKLPNVAGMTNRTCYLILQSTPVQCS